MCHGVMCMYNASCTCVRTHTSVHVHAWGPACLVCFIALWCIRHVCAWGPALTSAMLPCLVTYFACYAICRDSCHIILSYFALGGTWRPAPVSDHMACRIIRLFLCVFVPICVMSVTNDHRHRASGLTFLILHDAPRQRTPRHAIWSF